MNFADPMMAVALVVLLAAIAWAFWPKGRTIPALGQSAQPKARQPGASGRAMILAAREAGLDGAGLLIEQKLGEHETRQFVNSLTAAFVPNQQIPTTAAEAPPAS